ncbi:unnamed protein product, partial [Larinioides sclopetarius]
MGRTDVFSDFFESLVRKGSQFAFNYELKQLVSSIYSIATQAVGTRGFESYKAIGYVDKEKEAM